MASSSLRMICVHIWFFACSTVIAQKKNLNLQIDSAFIYQTFDDHGTTAGLSSNHRYLDSTNHELNKLNVRDLDILQSFVNSAKNKRLFQKKYGGPICYILAYSNGESKRLVATSTESEFWLDNLDLMRFTYTNDPKEVEQLNQLFKKYWREQN